MSTDSVVGWISAAVMVVLAAYLIGSAFGLNKADWAAWVQAIGSIGAIVGAIAVTNIQHRNEIELERQRRRRDDNRKILIVESLMINVYNLANEHINRFDGGNTNIREFEIAPFLDLKKTIDQLPLFDLPDHVLVIDISRVKGVLQELIDGRTSYVELDNRTMAELGNHFLLNDFTRVANEVLQGMYALHELTNTTLERILYLRSDEYQAASR